MSADLSKARQLITSSSQNLRQRKLVAAVTALYDGLVIVQRTQLLKGEREEFTRLIEAAVYQLNTDQEMKAKCALVLSYGAGREKELINTLRDVLNVLSDAEAEQVRNQMAEQERRRQELLVKCQTILDSGDGAGAKACFERLLSDNPAVDAAMQTDIADRLIKAGKYAEAISFLEAALQADPSAIHLYNRIGMVLRKTGDYGTAEQYFLRALEIAQKDEFLYFNLGRVYLDWRKWDKALEMGKKSLAANPQFEEARKMIDFAQKKMGQ